MFLRSGRRDDLATNRNSTQEQAGHCWFFPLEGTSVLGRQGLGDEWCEVRGEMDSRGNDANTLAPAARFFKRGRGIMQELAMVYAVLTISGVALQAPEPVAVEQCNALKAQYPQTLCVEVEPDCGKKTGNECLGRADIEEKATVKPKPKKKKRIAKKPTTKRYASTTRRPTRR